MQRDNIMRHAQAIFRAADLESAVDELSEAIADNGIDGHVYLDRVPSSRRHIIRAVGIPDDARRLICELARDLTGLVYDDGHQSYVPVTFESGEVL